MVCPLSYVSSSKSKLILKDFPLPLPPVIIKYLLSLPNGLYLGFSVTKVY